MEKKKLEMKFDPKTIKHLGVHQYSTLPPVIAELIANSYDAESENVTINLNDLEGNKEIIITDNGHGMCYEEINDNFLKIGRNRRTDEQSQKSKNGKRYVIGKKGIGKLSFFGIAEEIEITTVQNFIENSFLMDWNEIESEGEKGKPYNPKLIGVTDRKSEITQGTKIILRKIKRKQSFTPKELAYSLSKAFTVFDEPDFKVEIIHNNNNNDKIILSNEIKYEGLKKLHSWDFPKNFSDFELIYEYATKIKGEFFASLDTVPSTMKGIALFSRGKLVNEHCFYDLKASSFGYDYITGFLDVSFIDDWKKEVIATNRKSLIWEDEDAAELKKYLEKIIPIFYNEQKAKREEYVIKELKKITGIDLPEWIKGLPITERKIANNITKAIINSELDFNKQKELIEFTQDSFKFKSFHELAAELEENSSDIVKMIEFFNEWKVIEAKEFYKLSIVRIETIKRFQKLIEQNAKEIPVIHDFLVKFSWLLDPRLLNFKDEVTYSKLLEQNFKDDKEIEEDRRIDFLCHNFGDSFFIIELKRPAKVISNKELDQALSYVSFIRSKIGNEYGKNIYCFIIGNKLAHTDEVKLKAESYQKSGTVYFKTYEELLSAAINYHQEFIYKYEEIEKSKIP